MLNVIQGDIKEHESMIIKLFDEYLNWTNLMFYQEFGIRFEVHAFLEKDMAQLQQFAPPDGRLLLGEYDESKIAGCACLRKIGESVGEIKRMYVRPDFRRKGIGRCLLQTIIQEAQEIGFLKLRLDTALYAKEAQALYRHLGFQNTAPYAESEIPEKYRPYWVFMELNLT